MEPHLEVIRRFGGIRKMAEKLGHRTHGTVSGWWNRKRIPVDQWPAVAAAAARHGVPFDMAELMPTTEAAA